MIWTMFPVGAIISLGFGQGSGLKLIPLQAAHSRLLISLGFGQGSGLKLMYLAIVSTFSSSPLASVRGAD